MKMFFRCEFFLAQIIDMIFFLEYNPSKFAKGGRMTEEEKLKKALLKKALGYDAKEIIEEFSIDKQGVKTLSKKKITKKHFAPDLTALKLLIEKFYPNIDLKISDMTDEQLLEEKQRILQLLKEEEENAN